MKKPFIITIGRTFGSGGKTIAIALSEKLGIPCYEEQIIRMASDYSGISEQLFAQSDAQLRVPVWKRMLSGYPDIDRMARPNTKKFVSDDNMFSIQAQICRNLAQTESCIILGKCANIVLKDCDNVVSFFVDADEETCIANVCERICCSKEDAKEIIAKTDKNRREFYEYYSHGHEWKDPRDYDLMFNSSKVGFEKVEEMMLTCLKMKLGE